jgi:exonuclease VII large subunit
LEEAIKNKKNNLAIIAKNIFQSFENAISSTKKNLENFGRELAFKNPERQLRLGYSIVMKDGKIVKNTVGLMEGEMVDLKMSDGKVESQIKKIIKDNKKYYG